MVWTLAPDRVVVNGSSGGAALSIQERQRFEIMGKQVSMRSVRGTLAGAGVAALVPLGLLTACSGAQPTSDGGPATPDTAAVSTTEAPTSAPTPTATVTPTATTTPTSTATVTAAAPRWARALGEPQQGDAVWGVYLAVGHSATEAVIEQAVRDAATVGYQAVVGDIACDAGAMEALALDQYDYWSGATLYFATEADARAFAAAYTRAGHSPVGVAQVSVGCLD
jgi:hypothetical protein